MGQRSLLQRWLILGGAALLFALLLLLIAWRVYLHKVETFLQQPLLLEKTEVVTIKPGQSIYSLLSSWQQKGWLKEKEMLRWLLWQQPQWGQIRAGSYQLQLKMTLAQALQHLLYGPEHQYAITFIEGSRWRDWQKQLEQAPELTGLSLLEQQNQLLHRLGISEPHIEGWLYPDTYFYTAGTSALTLLQRAHQQMKQVLEGAWQKRSPEVERNLKSPYQALILASIIEKETGQLGERAIISSVFHNRFNKRMRLQTDPTVIYGMGESFNGNITKADLRRKTPYNTYRISGLPPTPIAMPGAKAIQAALQPEQTSYYYFVSKGDGSHVFARSLKEHNANVRRYVLGKE